MSISTNANIKNPLARGNSVTNTYKGVALLATPENVDLYNALMHMHREAVKQTDYTAMNLAAKALKAKGWI